MQVNTNLYVVLKDFYPSESDSSTLTPPPSISHMGSLNGSMKTKMTQIPQICF